MRTQTSLTLMALALLAASPAAADANNVANADGCRENCITDRPLDRPDRDKEYHVSCAPRLDTRVDLLNSPSMDDPITETWAQTVNPTWSFQVDSFVTVDGIQYASGIVVDGRGRWTDTTRYMVTAQWDCELYRF